MRNKILLLGSGELGKEVVIAMQRLGQYVIAVDNYKNAPAMQVAHEFEVIDMLNGIELDKIVDKHKPDFIVPSGIFRISLISLTGISSKYLSIKAAFFI